MRKFRIGKRVKPAGYMQFWDRHPPVLVVIRFPQPKMPLKLITKVNPLGEYVEFVYSD